MIEPAGRLTATESEVWSGLVAGGITHAISGLSEMVGRDIRTTYLSPRSLSAAQVHELTGGPEEYTVAIHVGVSGDATGHMLVLFQPRTAFDLVDLLMNQAPGATHALDEMELSVVGEMGNMIGAYFLSSLGDTVGVRLRPSPPTVMMDMAGAVIDAAIADLMLESDEFLVVETRFGAEGQQIRGTFLILPNPELRRVLVERWKTL